MLTSAERDRVRDELAAAAALQGEYQTLITTIFRNESTAILLDMPLTGQNPRTVADFVLTACLLSRWTRNPALLEMLLDYLITVRGIGTLQGQLERVRRQIDPTPDDYSTAWLGSRPFFDRSTLRTGVRKLVEENARPILLVSPSPDSFGRTYSRYFLHHLEDRRPDTLHVVYAELGAGTAPAYGVEDLLDTVGSQISGADRLPDRTSSDYARVASRWILRQLINQSGRWLLVLDGFGQAGLHPQVKATIEALAAAVPTGQYRLRVRLVLLDYPHALPGITPADVLSDALQPAAQIGLTDIEPCLAGWNQQRHETGLDVVPEEKLAGIAEDILGRVPAGGRARLEALNFELCGLHEYAGEAGS